MHPHASPHARRDRGRVPSVIAALVVALLAAVLPFGTAHAASADTGGARAQAATTRTLLIGQSTKTAWDDYTSFADAPAGGSVYYEVASGDWVGPGHAAYARFLADRGDTVQIGISWKDNPPGFPGGDGNAKAARSRQVTQELADGLWADRFTRLTDFIDAHPRATFLLRLDYEVSSHYHCTDATCSSYKGAFARIRSLIDDRTHQDNVRFVFHQVRGEYEALYPGDAVTDEIGVSVFAHELCMPIHDSNGYLYNGTPPDNYDVGALQCRNASIGTDTHGNPAAVWKNWDYDGNVLKMMKFAQDHGKKMVVSESGLMNLTADGADTGGLEPVRGAEWTRRLFGLLDYRGPIPNLPGTYDLSDVITTVTYIDLDFRYGWDGIDDGSFDFPPNSTWFADGRLSRYTDARTAFCQGLAQRGFTTGCRA
ncbi:hypothetical protein ACGF7W_35725 [Streptomyces sp. NPDC048219]|uniref:hypothetical protein n=1 Tax=Streptomyces sp. NPDC048219 TaxID=3365517 RepID=UPI003710BE34